jgi:hypothetical protein
MANDSVVGRQYASDDLHERSKVRQVRESISATSRGFENALTSISRPKKEVKAGKGKRIPFVTVKFVSSTAALRDLLDDIVWPEMPVLVRPMRHTLEAVRSVRASTHSESGFFLSKKLNRFVQYESLMEMKFFRMLEDSVDVLWYLEQPLRIRYYKDKDKEPTIYVPDVLVALSDEQYVVVEIKPVTNMRVHYNLEKFNALRGHCGGVGWGVLLTDGRFSYTQLAAHKLSPAYVGALLSRLAKGPLSEREYREYAQRYDATEKDLSALIVQEEIVQSINPFKLERCANPLKLWPRTGD